MATKSTSSRRPGSASHSAPATVRVSPRTHRELAELARESGEPMTVVLARAVERERRARLFERAAEQWQEIEADPEARAELEAEYALWDETAADGLPEAR